MVDGSLTQCLLCSPHLGTVCLFPAPSSKWSLKIPWLPSTLGTGHLKCAQISYLSIIWSWLDMKNLSLHPRTFGFGIHIWSTSMSKMYTVKLDKLCSRKDCPGVHVQARALGSLALERQFEVVLLKKPEPILVVCLLSGHMWTYFLPYSSFINICQRNSLHNYILGEHAPFVFCCISFKTAPATVFHPAGCYF